MSIKITMPALSPTMEEGTLAKWHVKEGDSVSSGDVIAEIETDKATMEVESIDEGVVGKILVAEGAENVKVNAVIAILLEEGENAKDISETPAAAPKANVAPVAVAEVPATPAPEKAAPVPAPAAKTPAAPRASGERVFSSPLARRLAKDANIDISQIAGSGPRGRVVKADVERAKAGGNVAPIGAGANATSSAPIVGDDSEYTVVPADSMRKIVAERLTQARQEVPQFYLTADVKIDVLMKARADINATAKKDENGKPEFKLSINDFVMKAWAIALQQVPEANATWAGDAIHLHKHSDVAVAVAVPGGLFTPVVRKAELKSLKQISADVKDLAGRARSKKLKPHEYQGGSSAVSNLGMFGVKHFTSIINPPHGTIISIGVGEERVYPDNGDIKIGTFMTISVSCDHRSVDGALGAQLMAAFKALMEQPVMMLA